MKAKLRRVANTIATGQAGTMKTRLTRVCEEEIRSHPLWLEFQKCLPGWQIRFREMDDDERICWDTTTIWLAMWRWPGPDRRAAHAVAHVKLHYGTTREFTEEECAAADDLGQCWLSYTAALEVA